MKHWRFLLAMIQDIPSRRANMVKESLEDRHENRRPYSTTKVEEEEEEEKEAEEGGSTRKLIFRSEHRGEKSVARA